MPANVEIMFSVRETPWHGLGRIVMEAVKPWNWLAWIGRSRVVTSTLATEL